MTATFAGLTISLPSDVPSAAEMAAAVRGVVDAILQTHDAAFRVALESEGPTIERLASFSRDDLVAEAGNPIRYALVSLLPPLASGVDVSLSGRARRVPARVLVEVWYQEDEGDAERWLKLVSSHDATAPGVLAAFQHGSTLAVTGRLDASGAALPDASCTVAAPGDVQAYRGGFGQDSVPVHTLRYTLTLT